MSKYIDVEKLLILLESFIGSRTTVTTPKPYIAGLQRAEKIIKAMPVADVQEVKHGEWIEVSRPTSCDKAAICECSICGDTIWVYSGQREWKYCPNCGAKMDGGTK